MRHLAALILLLPLLTSGCIKSIPNDPALVEKFQQRTENFTLEFQTAKGRQVAYYLPQLNDPESPPERIAILFPGIHAIALGWLNFINLEENPDTAYLLIDYPGRGESEGIMRPEKNYENTQGALESLVKHFGAQTISAKIGLMGHSFGTGAALQFARINPVDTVVLVAPFNDLKRAVRQQSLLLSLLMPSQIDNRQQIRELLDREAPPQINILHGRQDTTLPFSMGKELAEIDPEKIAFYPFPEDDHVNILTHRRELIFGLLSDKQVQSVAAD